MCRWPDEVHVLCTNKMDMQWGRLMETFGYTSAEAWRHRTSPTSNKLHVATKGPALHQLAPFLDGESRAWVRSALFPEDDLLYRFFCS